MNILTKTLFTLHGEKITGNILLKEILIPIILIIGIAIIAYYVCINVFKSFRSIGVRKELKNTLNLEETKKLQLNSEKRAKRRIKRLFRVVAGLAVLFIILSFASKLYYENSITSIFTTPFYKTNKTSISLFTLFLILFLGYVSYWVSALIRSTTKSIIQNMPDESAKRYSPLVQVMGYLSLVISFFIGLTLIGIDISSFAFVFGILGVGLGFGLQDIVANFFSGLVISMSRVITEGDRVFIQGIEGDVQRINIINTIIRNITLEELIVPNKIILNEAIQNYSHSDSDVIISTEVGVDYSSDMHFVKDVLLEAARQLQGRKETEDPIFRLKSFGDSGIIVGVMVFISDVRDKYRAKSDLNMLVWQKLKENKISIPFPQVDLHIKDIVDDQKQLKIAFKTNQLQAHK